MRPCQVLHSRLPPEPPTTSTAKAAIAIRSAVPILQVVHRAIATGEEPGKPNAGKGRRQRARARLVSVFCPWFSSDSGEASGQAHVHDGGAVKPSLTIWADTLLHSAAPTKENAILKENGHVLFG